MNVTSVPNSSSIPFDFLSTRSFHRPLLPVRPVLSPSPSATRSEWGGRIRRESTRSISINDRKNSSRYIPSLDRPEWRAQPGHALWNLLTVFYPLPSYYFRFKRCQPCRRFEERTRKRVQGVNGVIYRCFWPMNVGKNKREETVRYRGKFVNVRLNALIVFLAYLFLNFLILETKFFTLLFPPFVITVYHIHTISVS